MATSATTGIGLTADALAVIDLRYLTQSELLALSMCSGSSTGGNYSNGFNEERDFSVPKIDRSVFNESAGSRKQTYSRLRLAPRKPANSTRSNHRIVKAGRIAIEEGGDADEEEGDWENRRIMAMVRELIGEGDGEQEVFVGLVEARVECDPEMEGQDMETARHEVKVEIGAVSPVRRKRGRPRKDSDVNVSKIMLYESDMDGDEFNGVNENVSRRSVEDDKELMNRNGEVVDLDKLGNRDEPFVPELRRRTEGMGKKEELLEFLNGLEGQWVSRRRKRKIVDAAGFGDALPLGWKLLFSIKKKAGVAWLICRRYISPSGRQFVSCKDVSSYLQSLCGMQEEDQQISVFDGASTMPVEQIQLENVGDAFQNEFVQNLPAPPSQIPVPVTLVDPVKEIASSELLPNHDLTQLPPSSSKNKLKRRRGTLVSDGVIMKDGKFECQFCHKQFEERRRYNGHVGSHVRHVVTSENKPKGTDPASAGGGIAIISGMDTSIPSHYSPQENHQDANSYDNMNLEVPHTDFEGGSQFANFTEKDDIGTSQNVEHNANDEAVVGKPCDDLHGESELADELVEKDDNSVIYGAKMYSSAMSEVKSLENETNKVYEESRTPASHVNPVGEDKSSENSTVVCNWPGRESEIVDKSIDDSTRFEKELRNDIDIGSIQTIACTEKASFTENIADGLISHENTEHTIDFTEHFGNGRSPFGLGLVNNNQEDVCSFYQQETSGKSPVAPFPTEQQQSTAIGENGMVASNIMEYKIQDPYDGNPPSLVTDKPAVLLDSKYFDGISVSSSKPTIMDVNNHEIQHTVVPASNHAIPNENDWSRDAPQKIFGVTYHSPSLNQPLHVNNGETAPTDVPSTSSPWKNFNLNPQLPVNSTAGASSVMASKEFWKAVDDPANSVAKIVNEPSLDMDVIPSLEQRKGSSSYTFSSLLSDQGVSTRNDLAVIGNTPTQERRQEPDIFRGFNPFEREQSHNTKMFPTRPMGQSSVDEVRFPLSSELKISLGNNQSRLDVDAVNTNLKGRSLVLSGNEHFGLQTNTNAFYSSSVEEPRNPSNHGHERGLLDQFGQGLYFGLQNNLNQAYSGPVWGGNRLGPAGSFVPNHLMSGFNNGQPQRTENVLTEANWRGATTHGLAEGSMSREQPGGYPHNYQLMPNEVGDQFFGTNLGGFQDQRGGLQHREYNFINAQAKPYTQDTDVLPYESQMQQTYDSSSWLERQAAFPQAQTGNQTTASCVWCSDVFYLESSFSQADNIIPQCPSCKSKMSQQLNLF